MAANSSPDAIVTWADGQTPKVHKGKGSSLTQDQLLAALRLRSLNKTQTEIAEALGCDQGTISRWFAKFNDTGELAGAYLRGSQLRLAKKLVRTARASDAIDVLDRFKSIPASNKQESSGLVVQIGVGVDGDAQVTLVSGAADTLIQPSIGQQRQNMQTLDASVCRAEPQTLIMQADSRTGSDKASNVN